MMRHPFNGLVDKTERAESAFAALPNVSVRRGFLIQSLSAIAAAGAWLVGSTASAQWGRRRRRWSGGRVTTYAVGEEGTGGTVTTYALGEEGSTYPPPVEGGGRVTTQALGEEGAVITPRPPAGGDRYTTQALGEEGGTYPPPRESSPPPSRPVRPTPPPDSGTVTTQALGEEG